MIFVSMVFYYQRIDKRCTSHKDTRPTSFWATSYHIVADDTILNYAAFHIQSSATMIKVVSVDSIFPDKAVFHGNAISIQIGSGTKSIWMKVNRSASSVLPTW